MNDIRVLLVESERQDAGFIREALIEIEEMTHAGAWLHCRVDHVETADEAVAVLEAGTTDVVLFNPLLPDSKGLATCSAFRDAAPEVPLIALLEASEENLGRRMLRHGAQDFLIKGEIDCRPLARMVLNAIERQRFERAVERGSLADQETGFYNDSGFRAMAMRDLELARQCGNAVTLLLAEIDSLVEMDDAYGREAVHQLLVEAANAVREAAGPTALVGRAGVARFAVLNWNRGYQHMIAEIQSAVQSGYHHFAFVFGYAEAGTDSTVDDLLKQAEAVLLDNRQACASLP